jgi:triosephosphate isomerase
VRRPFIAGNWKMNLSRDQAVRLAQKLARSIGVESGVELAVFPPSVYLEAVGSALAGSAIGLGAQNVYHESSGAFTGEVSPGMLVDIGCRYVIIGHSERRNILGESDQAVNRKIHAALTANLTPIVCIGELLGERQAGQTLEVIRRQFAGSLHGLSDSDMARVVIAYEPVWAIGTGRVATPDQAEQVHIEVRRLLGSRYNERLADSVRIQYGGSVKPDNAAALLVQPNIDGALVGGASLVAEDFLAIVAAARM